MSGKILILLTILGMAKSQWDPYYLPDEYYSSKTGPELEKWWASQYQPVKQEKLYNQPDIRITESLQNRLIGWMTAELMKDCRVKIRYQNMIQNEYKKDENYELGVIAASVMEKFTHMIQTYRYFAKEEMWDLQEMQRTSEILAAYQVMLSDYNEIRVEKNLFHDMMKESTKERHDKNADDALFKFYQSMAGEKVITEEDLSIFSPDEIEEMRLARVVERGIEIEKRRQKMGEEQGKKELKEMLAEKAKGKLKGKLIGKLKGIGKGKGKGKDKNKNVRPKRRTIKDIARNSTRSSPLTEQEYKRSLRQQKWMEKWRGFDPYREGISVSRKLARTLQNDSNFLGLNPF